MRLPLMVHPHPLTKCFVCVFIATLALVFSDLRSFSCSVPSAWNTLMLLYNEKYITGLLSPVPGTEFPKPLEFPE